VGNWLQKLDAVSSLFSISRHVIKTFFWARTPQWQNKLGEERKSQRSNMRRKKSPTKAVLWTAEAGS
jgi:hypothetical protein